jgi:ABC-2 type transport system permease protein
MSSPTRTTGPQAPATQRAQPERRVRQWRAFVAITWASLLSQVRNVATFFFGLLFPLVFISVFGLIGNATTSVKLGVTDGSDQTSPIYVALSHISAVQIKHGSAASLNAQLTSGQIDGVLTITAVTPPPTGLPTPTATPTSGPGAPPGGPLFAYNVTLATSSASPQSAATARTFVQAIVDEINLRAAGITHPAIALTTEDVAGRHYSYIDFILPGQLGFSLLSIAVFGTAFGFVVLKRTLVFKRIFATPTRPATIVLGQGASRLIIAFLQVVVLLVAGVYLFHFDLANGAITFVEMLVVALFGLIAFLGFGLIIAGIFNNENAMGPVVNLITLPQFLLSGSFFPTDIFPAWVQPIANNLPLSYMNVALRKIASEGASLYDVRYPLLGILAWGVGTYVVAVLTFRWE